jgi:hypothetical protein
VTVDLSQGNRAPADIDIDACAVLREVGVPASSNTVDATIPVRTA